MILSSDTLQAGRQEERKYMWYSVKIVLELGARWSGDRRGGTCQGKWFPSSPWFLLLFLLRPAPFCYPAFPSCCCVSLSLLASSSRISLLKVDLSETTDPLASQGKLKLPYFQSHIVVSTENLGKRAFEQLVQGLFSGVSSWPRLRTECDSLWSKHLGRCK